VDTATTDADKVSSRRDVGFWSVAASITILVLGANTPLPLLTIYQEEWHFTEATLTIIYSIYTAGVIAAVFLLGPLSDATGRKAVLVPAMAVMAAGLLCGLAADGVPMLLASRLLQGLAIGAGVTTAIATLGDLAPKKKSHDFVALVTTSATVFGLAGGPLVAGMLAEFGPWPDVLPYVVSLALLIPAFAGVALTPETVRIKGPLRFRPKVIAIPRSILPAFLLACHVEMTAYAVAGTMAGLGGSFARDLLHEQSHAMAGLVVALLFLTSAAAQIMFNRWTLAQSMLAGLAILLGGLVMASAALGIASMPLFFAAAACLGAGHGLAYVGSQELTDRIAPSDRRAEVFSGFQLALYIGATAPAVAVGFGANAIGLANATYAFLALIAVLSLAGIVWIRCSAAAALRS
jgi:MFS family permease